MAKKQKWNWQEALVGKNKRMRGPFPTLEQIEHTHIHTVIDAYGHNLVHAAKALGVSRSTLYRKIDSLEKATSKKIHKSR